MIVMISEQADLTTVVSYDDVVDCKPGLRAALDDLATGEPWRKPEAGGRMSIDVFLDAVDDIGVEGLAKNTRGEIAFPFRGTPERPISRVYVFYDFQ